MSDTKKITGNLEVTGTVTNGGVNIGIVSQSISYQNLYAAVSNSALVPGRKYRIIDYKPIHVGTNYKMAGHQFDIIVTADSKNTLNENASACLHDGDTYFVSNDLSAWQLKYKLAYSTETGWCGLITFMKDEFNNECPFDFKNVVYLGSSIYKYTTYSFTATDYFYTFSSGTSAPSDKSLTSLVQKNKIVYIESIEKMPIIVFLVATNGCYNNALGEGCYNNTFGNDCHNNTFDDGCYNNALGEGCYNNTFGNGCHNNTLGNYCYSTIFSNYCYSNTFSTSCQYNTFGNYCYNNIFGTSCQYNTLGNSCSNNTFGNGCQYNTLGNYCYSNIFSSFSSYNTFGNDCYSNMFSNYCQCNTFDSGCYNNTFGNSCYHNTFGNGCLYNVFGIKGAPIDYCQYNIFDSGVGYVNLTSADTTASDTNYLQNVHVCLGIHGASSSNRLTITVPDRNLAYETTYKAAGSTEVILN